MRFKSVFLLLIGMISFTALASTPMPDENQKSELLQTEPFQLNAYAVVEPILFTAPTVTINTPVTELNVTITRPAIEFETITYTAVMDVGWQHRIVYKCLNDHDNLQENETVFKPNLKHSNKRKAPPLIRNS
ncbi:MAG: hypothetical protein C0525_01395 [Flavobacterium sp.]|uniref:hypothetical protein n=1 Tax=Flavobacterium sp. TaxID=239 RepID=UPI0025BC538E|nr:hypothetical protein [Flavobacterium sp.]MBA4133356.1 hypothetical protein [Flavobacterium sp.]